MVLQEISQAFRTYRDSKKAGGEEKLGKGGSTKLGTGKARPDTGRVGMILSGRASPITTPSGAILPKPETTRFGLPSIVCSIMIGIFIGSNISKMVANFLEEKELFIPSDDDDDDD